MDILTIDDLDLIPELRQEEDRTLKMLPKKHRPKDKKPIRAALTRKQRQARRRRLKNVQR